MKTFNELHGKDIEAWLAQGANKSVDRVWGVDLIMKYFGEWVGNRENAKKLMDELADLVGFNYSDKLMELRRLLIDKYDCKDIPFIIKYK